MTDAVGEIVRIPIVLRALVETVTDMGQLTNLERKSFARAVRAGILAKGKGGPFPILKTVYAHAGFDFAGRRREKIAIMRRAMMFDEALREASAAGGGYGKLITLYQRDPTLYKISDPLFDSGGFVYIDGAKDQWYHVEDLRPLTPREHGPR